MKILENLIRKQEKQEGPLKQIEKTGIGRNKKHVVVVVVIVVYPPRTPVPCLVSPAVGCDSSSPPPPSCP